MRSRCGGDGLIPHYGLTAVNFSGAAGVALREAITLLFEGSDADSRSEMKEKISR